MSDLVGSQIVGFLSHRLNSYSFHILWLQMGPCKTKFPTIYSTTYVPKLNFCIEFYPIYNFIICCFIFSDDVAEAYNLIKDLEPTTPQEYILKGVVNAALGQEQGSVSFVCFCLGLFLTF